MTISYLWLFETVKIRSTVPVYYAQVFCILNQGQKKNAEEMNAYNAPNS